MKCLTFTSYLNAYALYISASQLGIELKTCDLCPTLPIPCTGEIDGFDWLLFTEEASLRRALIGEFRGKFLPSSFPLELLDDKWAFAEWLNNHHDLTAGLKQSSLSWENNYDFPCIIKAKHSWVENVKLPRGWVCRSQEDVFQCRLEFEQLKLSVEHFFVQEWLGDKDCKVISVCGFFDCSNKHRNLTCTVERIVSYEIQGSPSCSAVVGTVFDKWKLQEKTSKILDALDYCGPFELEFLMIDDGQVSVLELNPRFWMQHSLFIQDENSLLKRYFGIEEQNCKESTVTKKLLWIDSLYLLESVALLRLSLVLIVFKKAFIENYKIFLWPSLPIALVSFLKIYHKAIIKKIKIINNKDI